MLQNPSDVIFNSWLYSPLVERPDFNNIRFQRSRLSLVLDTLSESVTKALIIVHQRLPHVDVAETDEDGNVAIRPD